MNTDSSLANILQTSESLEEDLLFREQDLLEQPERPKRVKKHFNLFSIIAAALVFITIIGIFEIIRLYMEHLAATDKVSKDILYDRTIGQIYYTAIALVITIIVILIFKSYGFV